MTESELIQRALIAGAIGGLGLSILAFVLSRFTREIIGRSLLAIVLILAGGSYFGFAVSSGAGMRWMGIETLHVIGFGTALCGPRPGLPELKFLREE